MYAFIIYSQICAIFVLALGRERKKQKRGRIWPIKNVLRCLIVDTKQSKAVQQKNFKNEYNFVSPCLPVNSQIRIALISKNLIQTLKVIKKFKFVAKDFEQSNIFYDRNVPYQPFERIMLSPWPWVPWSACRWPSITTIPVEVYSCFLIGQFPASIGIIFVYSVQLTVKNQLPRTGFEPRISGVGNDRSTHCVAITAQVQSSFYSVPKNCLKRTRANVREVGRGLPNFKPNACVVLYQCLHICQLNVNQSFSKIQLASVPMWLHKQFE